MTVDVEANCDVSTVPNYVAAAVPFFFLFIILEALVGHFFRGRKVIRITELIASLNLGITQQLLGMWFKGLSIGPYIYIYRHFRLTDLNTGWYSDHLIIFLGVDLAYYLFHRNAHVFHSLWAAHSVHHSGEDYNLATALRQGALQEFSSWFFYLPMAFMGVPPTGLVFHKYWNLLYQFFIHTEQIDRLGVLEYILNTPAHHRMHHRPPGNCNYGGVLIIWDKLFGTFIPEDRIADYYGLAKQMNTFNAVAANASHWKRMANIQSSSSAQEGSVFSKLKRWAYILVSRRVNHALVIYPFALFEERSSVPLRHSEKGLAGSRETRAKYTGVLANTSTKRFQANMKGGGLISGEVVFYVYVCTHFLILLVLSYILLLSSANVNLTFIPSGGLTSILSADGLFEYIHERQNVLQVLYLYLTCMYAVNNVGVLTDRGMSSANGLFGEPLRLTLAVGTALVLAVNGAVSFLSAIVLGVGFSLSWLAAYQWSSY
jgi:sterol desaturase/sphingolipid hydroxylase (fatty acid hydroxylase superfamily)